MSYVYHLISSKRGKYGAAACTQERGKLAVFGGSLVEEVGQVTCEPCQHLVLSLYGERAKDLYPSLKD